MICTDIPSILASDPRKTACERLANALPDCACEAVSVETALSPGVVSESETLARFVSAYDYDIETGTVKPSLFSHAGTNGMSVSRIEQAGQAAIERQQLERGSIGYVTASCGAVRELLLGSDRAFAVYDTALEENIYHADVCQAVFRPKSQASEMRRKLQLVFDRSLRNMAKPD